MAKYVVGLFDDASDAQAVESELRNARIGGNVEVHSGNPSSIVGRLTGVGIPDADANAYAEGIRRGGSLVTVHTDTDDQAYQAAEIMNRYNIVDIDQRSQEYRAGGWTGYDESAGPYEAAGVSEREPTYADRGTVDVERDTAYAGTADTAYTTGGAGRDTYTGEEGTTDTAYTTGETDRGAAFRDEGETVDTQEGIRDDYARSSKVGTAGGAVAGAATGAAVGSAGGPVGTAVGGVAGAAAGAGVGAGGDTVGSEATDEDRTRADDTTQSADYAPTGGASGAGYESGASTSGEKQVAEVSYDTTTDVAGTGRTTNYDTTAGPRGTADYDTTAGVTDTGRTTDYDTTAGTRETTGYTPTAGTAGTRGTADYDTTAGRTSDVQAGDEAAVPIVEEELRVGKRDVERGGVRVDTRVEETPVEEQVQLRDETVRVERRPVDQPASDTDLSALQEGTFEVRERGEEAAVDKQARVVEEVAIRKDVDERTETVSDSVRRTDVDVEDLSGQSATSGYRDTGTAGTTGYRDADTGATEGTTGRREPSFTDRIENATGLDIDRDDDVAGRPKQ